MLAAGRSRRMGVPKPLLRVDGETFVERVIHTLRDGGCEDPVVVSGADAGHLAELVVAAGARVAVNPDPDSEQIASLRIGLVETADEADAVVVLPTDHPLVRPDTVAALIEAYRERSAPIVRAVHRGAPGHPVLIDRALFTELGRDPLPRGAETVLERHAESIDDVAVDDPGVVADIDTPADYDRHVRPS